MLPLNLTRNRKAILVEKFSNLAHHGRQAAGPMKMLHKKRPEGFRLTIMGVACEISSKRLSGEADAQSSCDSYEVNDCIG